MDRCFRTLTAALTGAVCFSLSGMAVPAIAQPGTPGSTIAGKGSAGGAAACVSCHGGKGEGNAAAGFPRLAGLSAAYMAEQLDNFAGNKRQNPIMAPIAKQLTPAERKSVAAYYAGLGAATAPADRGAEPLKRSDNGAWLALRGRWDDNLPACVQCHGPGGAGVGAAFPALAGQPGAYLAAQLRAFRAGTRPGGPLNMMKVVASKLTDADIDAVARHYGEAGASPVAAAQQGKGKN